MGLGLIICLSFPYLNVEVAYHISDLTKGNISEILRVWVYLNRELNLCIVYEI